MKSRHQKPTQEKVYIDYTQAINLLNNQTISGSWLAPYMYPSYPPPIPLWAMGKPRRKFVPYFGVQLPTTTTTNTTSTTPMPGVLDTSCSHLPPSCWNNSPYLPLPIECIGNKQDSISVQLPVLNKRFNFPIFLVSILNKEFSAKYESYLGIILESYWSHPESSWRYPWSSWSHPETSWVILVILSYSGVILESS